MPATAPRQALCSRHPDRLEHVAPGAALATNDHVRPYVACAGLHREPTRRAFRTLLVLVHEADPGKLVEVPCGAREYKAGRHCDRFVPPTRTLCVHEASQVWAAG